MWSTRQMVNRGDDRELFQRSTVRELVVYCCFLVVLIAITFGTTSSVMFYYTQVMGGLFTRAKDVDSVESFWEVCTGLQYKAGPRLGECYRQVEAEVVSNSRTKNSPHMGPTLYWSPVQSPK